MTKVPLQTMDRSRLIEEVRIRVRQFEITEEEILTILELQQQYREARRIEYQALRTDNDAARGKAQAMRSDAFEDLVYGLECLAIRKRHDLMCLVYLGRDISWYGFTRRVVADFVSYVDEWEKKPVDKLSGCTEPRYLAGKPLIDWLCAARKELSAGAIPDDVWVIKVCYVDDSEKTMKYKRLDDAWAAFRGFVSPENAKAILSVCFRGYSWTGKAVTRIGQIEYGR